MDPEWGAGLVATLLFAALFLTACAVAAGFTRLESRIRDLRSSNGEARGWSAYLRRSHNVLDRIGRTIPRSPAEMSRIGRRLAAAGFRLRTAVTVFHGAQAVLGLACLIGFAAAGRLGDNVLLYVVLSLFIGAAIPDLWLARASAKRRQAVQLALPDGLDLLVVAVEAGIGMDQALQRIGQELVDTHPELSEELHLYNLEVNAGRSRADALRNMGDRADVEDLKSFAAVLIQTDRFGTSIADTLRLFSDGLRTKRRQRAEELAAQMSVKMIPPMFLFILPATFVVVVGPALIGIARGLLPFLHQR